MTTRTGIARTLAALAATSFLALGLSACSSSSNEAFCKQGEERMSNLTFNNSDPAKSLQEAADGMNIDAPKEIADDWNLVREAITEMADVYKGVDTSNPDAESMAKLQEASKKMTSDEYQKASENIRNWTAKNCK